MSEQSHSPARRPFIGRGQLVRRLRTKAVAVAAISLLTTGLCLGASGGRSLPSGVQPATGDVALKNTASVEAMGLALGLWQEAKLPLHPMLVDDPSGRYILHLLNEPLVTLDDKWQWQCRLCKVYPSLDNQLMETVNDPNLAYGLKIDLELAAEHKWGDGSPVNGYDVLFTWQVANGVERSFAGKQFFEKIEHIGVDPSNPRRFTLFFRRAAYLYETLGSFFLLPQHLEQGIWNQFKKDEPERYFEASLYKTQPDHPGLYNGAFRLARRGDHGSLILQRNTARQKAVAGVEQLVVHALKNTPGKAGEMDIIAEPACEELNCLSLTAGRAAAPTRATQLVYGDSTVFEHIDLNLRNPFLRDRNVRKALFYAIDKEKLLSALEPEELIPAVSPVHPANIAFSADVQFYPYEPALARELLEHSRWVLDKDSQRRMKNDKALLLTLVTSDEPRRLRLAKALISDWAAIGVEVKHIVQGYKTFNEETLAKMRYEAMVLYAWELPMDGSLRSIFHSDAIPSVRNHYVGQNLSGWNSYKVDQVLHRLDLEFDPAKRLKLMLELQQQYTAALPGLPLYFRLQKAAIDPALRGFTIPGHQYPSSAHAAAWRRGAGPPTAQR